MAKATLIGRATFVRGRVTGEGDLEIAGRIEGDVAVSGEVVIDTSGIVAADVTGSRIVVRGAVKGDLVAGEVVVIEAGARVVGDLRAPRIAIAPGGLVRGHVQTGAAGAARPRAATAHRSTRSEEPKARPAVAARPAAARSSGAGPTHSMSAVAAAAARAAKAAAPMATTSTSKTNHKPAARSGPPAPVVPVLKKGTKAVQKKRG